MFKAVFVVSDRKKCNDSKTLQLSSLIYIYAVAVLCTAVAKGGNIFIIPEQRVRGYFAYFSNCSLNEAQISNSLIIYFPYGTVAADRVTAHTAEWQKKLWGLWEWILLVKESLFLREKAGETE